MHSHKPSNGEGPFKAPPFAPRIWIEGDQIMVLFHGNQYIPIPLAERDRLFLMLRHEEQRHRVRHPGAPWEERWSRSVQEHGTAIRRREEKRRRRTAKPRPTLEELGL